MFSRSLLRLPLASQTRYLHVSSLALAENNGVFGRFNPWAKKSTEPNTTNTENNDTPSEAIGNVTFDVDFNDELEFSSWKNTEVIEDVDQIHSSIRSIVSEHIQGLGDNDWKEASLADTDVKFKVIKESIKQTGKEIPNLELTNIATVNDLLAFYERVPDVTQTSVEKFFAETANSLPSNLTFEAPSKSS
ncbi:hypothetical protein BCR42DRAFT_430341 [Absidia repens]|uniref:Large ribosomal subunit protein mL50 n=1 Tax=Absidia repens TaxID=90262 RepID=A0A1X2HH25_9FUNG|nr:hypothetical protein BCR42DRAFT_430341 [Absidia repens]